MLCLWHCNRIERKKDRKLVNWMSNSRDKTKFDERRDATLGNGLPLMSLQILVSTINSSKDDPLNDNTFTSSTML